MYLFDGWAKESEPSLSTRQQWRVIIQGFCEFLGHDDAAVVTKADVQRWKQHLISLNLARKTVSDTRLAALKAVLRWGYDNEFLSANVAQGVALRRSKKPGEGMQGYDEGEARTIIEAALLEKSAVYRWVPLLLAQSGARVAEIGQLRGDDVRCKDGIWYMQIRAEAGSVKTEASERDVPVHSALIELGFIAFAKARPGPLFFDAAKRSALAAKPSGKIVGKNLAQWVRKLGLQVGIAKRKSPNHAWRHRFRTLARDAGVEDSIANALLGHVGQRYGTTSLEALKRAVEKMPLPGLQADNTTGTSPDVPSNLNTNALTAERGTDDDDRR